MKTEGGRELWKKGGYSSDASFDLTPGSTSRRVLSDYAKAKIGRGLTVNEMIENAKKKPKGKNLDTAGFKLTAEDEEILDEIWAEIAKLADESEPEAKK